MKELLKDVAVRALKTFWQTFLGVLVVSPISNLSEAKVALAAAVAAGLSASWNLLAASLKKS